MLLIMNELLRFEASSAVRGKLFALTMGVVGKLMVISVENSNLNSSFIFSIL